LIYNPLVEENGGNRRSIKNAIVGDNIGDALKDIAGPSITMLIKFSAYFSLILINYINI
jgi:Na+/H+-translocating membrane pyrophosphatase